MHNMNHITNTNVTMLLKKVNTIWSTRLSMINKLINYSNYSMIVALMRRLRHAVMFTFLHSALLMEIFCM